MKYWNENLKSMDEYIPGEQPLDAEDIIKLNTNENPFPPSQTALEAIKAAANNDLRLYPSPAADDLRKAFGDSVGLAAENIFAANGSDEIFTLLFRGFIEKDGLAAFPYPSYALYDTVAAACGIPYEHVPLRENFTYDLDAFLQKPYSLVVIANPNNPTGSYCSPEQIETFCGKFKGLFVVDEAYIDFYGGSAVSLVQKFDNLIVTRTFSKSYSLAGLRVGIAAAHPDIIKGFLKLKDSYNLDRIAVAGACAALGDERSFNYNTSQIRHCKSYLEERLADLEFDIVPSRGNFLFVKHKGIAGGELYSKLKEKGILVRHFDKEVQRDYIRITVGTMGEIKTLCKELEEIISLARQ